MSTFAIARAMAITAVPIHMLAVGPRSDRTIVPVVSSSSDHGTTRDSPKLRLRPCASGETTAQASSGTAVMSPTVASPAGRS